MTQGQLVEWAEQKIAQNSKTPVVRVVITALENNLVLLRQSRVLVGMEQLLTETPFLPWWQQQVSLLPQLSKPLPFPHPHFSWKQQLNPSFLPSSPCISQQQNWSSPHLWQNLEAAKDAVQQRQPAFDRRSTAHWECQKLSLLLTSYTETLTIAIFNNPKVMLAAAEVLKHETWSHTTDIREIFATALNGDALKACAFKTEYALQI